MFHRMHVSSANTRRGRRVLAAALLVPALGCIGNPAVDATTAEAINEIGNELGILRDENAQLQHQVDSLRSVVARQDTLIRQIANVAGIPLP